MTSDRHRTPVDAAHLRDQYDDAEKLRIRIETHARYSEHAGTFVEWVLPHVAAVPGMRLLDIGCGPGTYHGPLIEAGVHVVGMDQSAGMLAEVRAQSSDRGATIDVARGDASALPFESATFDRVMANHMMYYVVEQERALADMRRVLRSGGRIVLAANAGARSHFDEIHARAAASLGYEAAARDDARFTLDDLPLVRLVFPTADLVVRQNALVFPDAEGAMRYYGSGIVDTIRDRPDDHRHRAPLMDVVRVEIDGVIAREGAFRIEKDAGCFVAQV